MYYFYAYLYDSLSSFVTIFASSPEEANSIYIRNFSDKPAALFESDKCFPSIRDLKLIKLFPCG